MGKINELIRTFLIIAIFLAILAFMLLLAYNITGNEAIKDMALVLDCIAFGTGIGALVYAVICKEGGGK